MHTLGKLDLFVAEKGKLISLAVIEIQAVQKMPHVVVKMYAGRTEEQKKELADEIVKVIKSKLGSMEDSISVAIEDVNKADWASLVYKPDIEGKQETLYKKPGYKM